MNDNMINKLDISHDIAAIKHSDGDKQKSLTRTITSDVLFAGRRELLIKHASESYRLRITNQGKLILTK
jgi:hemin uptake protein HemP